MHPSEAATLIGSVGVGLLLLAFLLGATKSMRSDGYAYMTLNLVGASLAGYSSYLIGFLPFVILESAWVVVAAVTLIRIRRRVVACRKIGR